MKTEYTYDDVKEKVLQTFIADCDIYDSNQVVVNWLANVAPDFIIMVDNQAMEIDYNTTDVVDNNVITVLNEAQLQGKMFEFEYNGYSGQYRVLR